jgi:hypothetical protein
MKELQGTEQRPEADLTSVAVFNNSYVNTNPASAATGFRTNGLRHRSRSLTGQSRVAEDFLVGTRFLRIDREVEASVQTYFRPEGLVMLSLAGAESSQIKKLPKSVRLRREVGDVIARRRSTRRFTHRAPSPVHRTSGREWRDETVASPVPRSRGSNAALPRRLLRRRALPR